MHSIVYYQLPAALPTSVEGNTGYIRYSGVVNLDRPMWPDQEFDESLTVLKPYPLVKEERKTFLLCCLLCCCETDQVFLNARIPVSGYTPGQTVELYSKITNKSNQTFNSFEIQIVKHIQYYTYANSSRTTYDTIVLEEKSCGGCQQGQSKSYTVNITVPPVPPTDESTSNIVKVSYRLRIRGPADCCREDAILDFPITIGTYPILIGNVMGQTITQQPTPLAQFPSNNYGLPTEAPTQLPTNAYNPTEYPSALSFSTGPDADGIDPPTYEEAISGNPANVNGKVFEPSYPVFRRTPSYSTDSNNQIFLHFSYCMTESETEEILYNLFSIGEKHYSIRIFVVH